MGSWATPRDVPMPSSKLAQDAFDHLCVEASRLLGASRDFPLAGEGARATEWPGALRIGVSGRLVRVMVARPRFPEILYGESDWESLDQHQSRLEPLSEPASPTRVGPGAHSRNRSADSADASGLRATTPRTRPSDLMTGASCT
jgi:hypothetical protein